MNPTETEDNANGGNDVSPKSHGKGFHHSVSKNPVNEGDDLDEKLLVLSSESGGEIVEVPHESLVSGDEWVCKSPSSVVSSTDSGWPSFVTKSSSQPYSLSAEEQSSVAALNLQHKALNACQKFLGGWACSDSEEDDNEDEDDDEIYDSEECVEYKFFERVFAEDVELRKYYENHHKEGDFYCLVCGGIGKKVWKRFKDSVALIQHSTAVLRTKRKRAHRAYAHVICKVVGWDIDQLPAVALKDWDSSFAASGKLLAKNHNGGEIVEVPHESLVSGDEWVCKIPISVVSSTDSGWPSFVTKSSSQPYSLSAEEQSSVAALNLQHKALNACQKFLGGWACSDSEEDDNEDEDDDEIYDSEECVEYKFFERVFAEDVELRKYYENHHKKGDFYCLVCGGIGKKVWKRFKDSVALIQHSTAVLRTKRKRAHRAYAHVICKVVGWDIDQLPAVVLKDWDSSFAASGKLLAKNHNGGEIVEVSHESLVSGAEWVCKSPRSVVSSTDSGWPSFVTKSSSQPYSLSAEEQSSVAALNLQHKALEACQKFLGGFAVSDSDEDDNEDDDDEDEDYDSEECEYKFFERVFAEDVELRKYYENYHKQGDFYCLVCGGIGKKVWKRFKDSVALIQHSTAVLRTKRKRAHRAYAHIICKVVGWDMAQLPAIVLKDFDSSLAASRKLLAEAQKPVVSEIDDSCDEPDDNPVDH